MKTTSLFKGVATLALGLVLATGAQARDAINGTVGKLPVQDVTLQRNGSLMTVDMDMMLKDMKLDGDKAVLYTPYITNGTDSLELPAVGLYSRTRWYQYERYGQFLGAPTSTSMRYSERPDVFDYTQNVAYRDWMNGAYIAVKEQVFGCCRSLEDQLVKDFGARYREFVPSYLYQTVPDIISVGDMAKTRELKGRAFVDFKVNQIVILPEYRNNTYELGKIIASIDSVKNDPDITVNSITIKGTASPEGPYDNNVYLAKNRTIALKNYVDKLYDFPEGFIKTDYDPVDWAGLREYLQTSVLEKRQEILDIVNSDLEPFARNQKIKTTYPNEYKFLLENVYPALRHSDYVIEYTIRQFTTYEEIAGLLHTQPGTLSLNEMLYLAQSYEPGSDEFNDVFEMAVRMFPDDPVANLNVATSAMQRGDMVTVERYLPKAGNSPEAVYARANYAFLNGNYQDAAKLYAEAAEYLPQAQEAYQNFIEAGYLEQ